MLVVIKWGRFDMARVARVRCWDIMGGMRDKKSLEEDRQVAKGLMRGDKRVLRAFYGENYPKLMAYVAARVRTKEDAEEIVQDTFLGFLDSLPVFSFRSCLWTFLVGIARHEVSDYFRRLYAKRAIKCVPFLEHLYSEPVYSAEETVELFNAVMKRVSAREREILLWKYEDGLSVKEIAQRLGVGMKAAESRLFRARRSFGVAYEEVVV